MRFVSTEAAAMSKLTLLLWVMHLTLINTVDSSNVHYIIPSPTTQCPEGSCLTLSTLAANSSYYSDPNTTMVFLEGSHTLDSELIVSKINGSLMLLTHDSGTADILCSDGTSLDFSDINHLQICGLEFIRCSVKVDLVKQFIMEDSIFRGGINSSALHINHTNTSIAGSSFVTNTAGTYQSQVGFLALYSSNNISTLLSWPCPNIQSTSTRVGGALIITSSTVNISSTYFDSNTAKIGGAIFSQLESNVNITNCIFINNSAIGCSDDGCLGGALFIDSGCTVTTHNSTFMNNTAGYGGGAIALFQGRFLDSVHNVFSRNKAGTSGGAISAYSHGSITINNSCYSNNAGRYGGAMYTLSYGNITVNNSSFRNNKAGNSGGVLHAQDSSSITVSNSFFISNQAVNYHGGVIFAQSNSKIEVGNSSFDKNKAGCDGGVMYAHSNSSITVDNSSFNHNKADDDGGVIYGEISISIMVVSSSFDNNTAVDVGGVAAAALSTSTITVGNSFFNNSEAGNSGGVLHVQNSSSITVSNSVFISNEAINYHGGVMVAHSNSSINVDNSFFDKNKAGYYGGVMFTYSYSSITVDNSSFNHNIADDYGGVIYAKVSSNIIVGSSFFQNNTALNVGGVAVTLSRSTITVGNSFFDNNKAGKSGGALHAQYSSSITINSSSFYSNMADAGGVAAALSTSTITVGNSFFNNNEAGNSGGVLHVQNSGSITVNNSFFISNKARNYHGGVMVAHSNSNIKVSNSSFDNNKAGNDGGGIFAYSNSSITVGNSLFDNNKAGNSGGVLRAWESSSIMVSCSSFDNNTAGGSGGVAALSTSTITVSNNSSFDNNKAGSDGGVMFAYSNSSITVSNSSFDDSEAGHDGGVIYAAASSNIYVDNSCFDNSEAGYSGGVMCAYFSSSIIVGRSSFNGSKAGSDGGVMNARHNSTITVDSSSFDNNKVGSDGGVIYASFSSSISMDDSSFDNNKAGSDGGVIYASFRGSITVSRSSFDNNEAGGDGGAMDLRHVSMIIVDNCSFDSNEASDNGGAIYAYSSTITIVENLCTFFNNSAVEGGVIYVRHGIFEDLGNMYIANIANDGGVMTLNAGSVKSTSSSFVNNTAVAIGGVLYVSNYTYKHQITFTGSTFYSNHATRGGVFTLLTNDNLVVTQSFFMYNSAISGGSIYLQTRNNVIIKYSNFSQNLASHDGGVFYLADQNRLTVSNSALCFNRAENNGGVVYSLFQTELLITGHSSNFIGNQAHRGGVVYASESSINIQSRVLLIANNTAINDGGALHLSNANVTFSSKHNTIVKNVAMYGGAIFADETILTFSNGSCKVVDNQAHFGGAIYASESKLVVETNSWTNVSSNIALNHGGGLYMTMSKLYAEGHYLNITKNEAKGKGGGIHAANSSIIIEREINVVSNKAENGGAISLERNAKLDGKVSASCNLISNSANCHGGAIYVNDKSNPEMCAAIIAQNKAISSKTECFSKSVFINFLDNFAGSSGANIFGGLLDRCTMHTESYKEVETSTPGLASFQNSSNVNESLLDTISSHPVRLCFCRDGQPDCDYQPEPIQINRGKAVSFQLIAYNHVSKPVRAAVDISSSGGGIVGSYINEVCTEAVMLQQFNLLAPVDLENLTLSVIGPCNVNGVSTRNVIIKFTCTCPIGFQIINNNETSCDCICHQVLQVYKKTECNLTLESIIRRENFWVSYINPAWSNSSTSGYILHPHCPFDYCYTPSEQVSINLNLPNGSDAQCTHNRMGTLCGTCKPGLSVSLGSSKCVPCPTYWPGLLVIIIIVFITSGIGLVAFLLALNLTVAIGTLNATIFYANIVAANKSVLFPSGSMSFASVFVSWLNFDIGFDVCFFDGMDTYIKTWLQLAFPAYIIVLVVVIIQLSYYFNAFGRLVGKKDPVATLATLILLSYTKLLQTIITAFSSATLIYPDGSKKSLWLPDATIESFTSKHAVLFFTVILILILGFMYTLFLFSWQWFLRFPRKQVKLIQCQKFSSFMEIYLVPYTPNHRYWTGLLLLIRVSLYLVSAFNPSGDPRVTLSVTTFIMTSLLLYIASFSVRMYKNHFINIMEIFTYFNIIALSIFTWYTIDADTNQTIITNISICIIFIQFTILIVYHAYKYMNQRVFAMIQKSVICVKIKKLTSKEQKRHNHEDIHRLHEILNFIDHPPAYTNDYNVQPKCAEPTISVVELPKPRLARATPPPLEAIEEELKLQSTEQQQESEKEGIDMIPVTENLATEVKKNKQCINNYSGIQIVECNEISKNCETKMEHITTLKENSILQSNSNAQINNCTLKDVKQANEGASTRDVPPVPAVSALEEGVGSQYIVVKAEVHDC